MKCYNWCVLEVGHQGVCRGVGWGDAVQSDTTNAPVLPTYPTLTKRQREILTKMRDEDEELVYSGGIAWVGLERTSGKLVMGLCRALAISMDTFSEVGEYESYTINDTGRAMLGDKP